MRKWRVIITVEVIEADDESKARSHAADAVEGFPLPGVEVEYRVIELEEAQ